MAGRIRQSDVDEVKSRVSIAEVIGEYVSLKSAGIGSLKGLCPFHDERTASFHVRDQVGFYHCFGCGEGGDVYSFLQKIDGVSFAEAVERLAARLGYELHYEDGGPARDRSQRSRLLAANAAAQEFFAQRLAAPDAEPARRFLGERGFDAQAAARFGVGYAPKSWDELGRHLRGAGFNDDELLAAGLVSQGERGRYDRFRGRLVWPIRDVTGQTLGFGARRLLDDDNGPKYLNTPETEIYRKSQVLYGLDVARREIARSRRVVIVEGYTDVMACHLAGVTTAVATCGTAFGGDHVSVLRRVLGDDGRSGEVVFTFDPDEAGRNAALRAFGEEHRFAAQTFVAVPPAGLDPCDLRLQRGDDAVLRMVEAKTPMFEFVLRQTIADYDLDTVEGRIGALRSAAPIVAAIRDAALRPGYSRELARMLGLEIAEVATAVRQARSASASRGGGHPAEAAPRHVSDWNGSDLATRLERDALVAVLQHPESVGHELVEMATAVPFGNETLAVVRDAIAAALDQLEAPDWAARVAGEVPAPFVPVVHELAVAPIPERSAEALGAYARGVVGSLVEKGLLRRKAELVGRLQRAGGAGEEYDRVQRELVELETQRRRLREE